jgi:hypothetical protein
MLDRTSPTIRPSDIKIGRRTRRDLGDIDALAADINEIGLLQPIVVDEDNNLIAGARRLAAWKKTKFCDEPIPVRVVDLKSIVRGECSENVRRKGFTPSEAVEIARRLEPLVRAAARDHSGGRGKKTTEHVRTREVLGTFCGLGGRTLVKAMQVVDAADRDPRFTGIVRRMDDTGNVDAAYRALLGKSTQRLMAAPDIFVQTKIGNVSLAEFSVSELRWLIAFFAEIGANMGVAPNDAVSVTQVLSAKIVTKAAAEADKARAR